MSYAPRAVFPALLFRCRNISPFQNRWYWLNLAGGLLGLEDRRSILGCTVGVLAAADSKLEDVVLEDDDDMSDSTAGQGGDNDGIRMVSLECEVEAVASLLERGDAFHASRRTFSGSCFCPDGLLMPGS